MQNAAPSKHPPQERQNTGHLFVWRGRDRSGKPMQGELQAAGPAQARAALRRQGLEIDSIHAAGSGANARRLQKQHSARISDKQITMFTRQLATMLQSGVALLQAFDIALRGESNPALAQILATVRADVEQGEGLHQAFRKHPQHFDTLFCNLLESAEQAGMLDDMLTRLAEHKEKSLALKRRIRAALTYPAAVVAVAMAITAIIMLWVVPAFKQIFASFGAELPLLTKLVMGLSTFMLAHWLVLLYGMGAAAFGAMHAWRTLPGLRGRFQRASLRLPLFGALLRQAAIARWSRTLATLIAAGVPLIDALQSVTGAAGNVLYADGTQLIRRRVKDGDSLHAAMAASALFPALATQMVAIGEESGALDHMLSKVAELHEAEVDAAVSALTSLMEPIIMAVLGLLIGGLVLAMYLPIFQMGSVV
ncbi:type II secretion system F family protein [Herbaspirillum lusitanum]|uniref:Type II secretion system F family protein n=1 Tax=Herbaspirillum lusitanum TaxID=213312 RepID=A0ABW9A755_9BURK